MYQVVIQDFMGTDLSVVNAARVSFDKVAEKLTEPDKKLIRYLMKNKHASPFEHCVAQFYVETNRRVSAEFMRHRTFSYNELSTRYTEVDPEGYMPPPDHMRVQKGKPGAYTFEPMDPNKIEEFTKDISFFNATVATFYENLIERGYPKELAAYILTLGNTTKFWVTGNLRNWFNFLTLRTAPNALQEIRDVAQEIEEHIEILFPECYAAWVENGRNQI